MRGPKATARRIAQEAAEWSAWGAFDDVPEGHVVCRLCAGPFVRLPETHCADCRAKAAR